MRLNKMAGLQGLEEGAAPWNKLLEGRGDEENKTP
jgi:hypothetical protein